MLRGLIVNIRLEFCSDIDEDPHIRISAFSTKSLFFLILFFIFTLNILSYIKIIKGGGKIVSNFLDGGKAKKIKQT